MAKIWRKKWKNFCSKMILGNFEQFWKRLSIHPRKCRNTLKKFWLDIDPMVKYGAAEAARVLTQCMVRLTQCLVPPTWYGRVGCGGYAGMRFPFMEKSKLLLNKYFGILHNVICFFYFPPSSSHASKTKIQTSWNRQPHSGIDICRGQDLFYLRCNWAGCHCQTQF